jgi:hypothetical protein
VKIRSIQAARSIRCARSRRLQDDIAIRRRVAGADQPDGLGHALLEIDVGLAGNTVAMKIRDGTFIIEPV